MPPIARGALVCARRRCAGSTSAPKRLPSKYFYDDVGSALFDAITRLPEYYLTAAETRDSLGMGMADRSASRRSGRFSRTGQRQRGQDALPDRRSAARADRSSRYSPIDISTEALAARRWRWPRAIRGCACARMRATISTCSSRARLRSNGKTLAMLMGSNIGNYEPGEARAAAATARRGAASRRRLAARRRSEEGSRHARACLQRSGGRNRRVQPQHARAHQPRARSRLRSARISPRRAL